MSENLLFNVKEIKDFFGDDEDILKDVYLDFKVAFPQMILNIENSLFKGDLEELERNVHTLKGVFRNFFAHKIVTILQEMENQANIGHLTDFEEQFLEIKTICPKFFYHYDDYILSKK